MTEVGQPLQRIGRLVHTPATFVSTRPVPPSRTDSPLVSQHAKQKHEDTNQMARWHHPWCQRPSALASSAIPSWGTAVTLVALRERVCNYLRNFGPCGTAATPPGGRLGQREQPDKPGRPCLQHWSDAADLSTPSIKAFTTSASTRSDTPACSTHGTRGNRLRDQQDVVCVPPL